GRRRVVDARTQRADNDIEHLPDAQREIDPGHPLRIEAQQPRRPRFVAGLGGAPEHLRQRPAEQMNVASDTAIRIIDTVIASCGTNSESASMDRCRVSEYATTPTYTARMPRTARDWMKSRSSWCEKLPDATCSTMSVIETVVVSTVSVVDKMKLSMSDAADASPGHRNRAHGASPEMRTSCSISEATMPTAAVRIGHVHNRADRKCLR